MKSFDNNVTIFITEAPSTFRTPIPFVRCAVAKSDNPNNPRQAMKIANPEKILNAFPKNCSFAYCSL